MSPIGPLERLIEHRNQQGRQNALLTAIAAISSARRTAYAPADFSPYRCPL